MLAPGVAGDFIIPGIRSPDMRAERAGFSEPVLGITEVIDGLLSCSRVHQWLSVP
jgi:hypothetical protein